MNFPNLIKKVFSLRDEEIVRPLYMVAGDGVAGEPRRTPWPRDAISFRSA